MAEIFLGFGRSGPATGQLVVIKNVLQEQREDPEAMNMLINEARLTASLSHPNVAQVLDLDMAGKGEHVLLVIEFIQGATIEEIGDAAQARNEGVPLGFVLAAVRDAAQGLAHAHAHKDAKGQVRPVVHRDVTPRNIMVDFSGTGRVLDFGIARVMGSARKTMAGMVRGTSAYMSPEQAIGEDTDHRTDIFSLGIIFHELLTGQRLFHRANPGLEMAAVYEGEIPLPSKVNRRVPKALDLIVMKALDRDKSKRYQSAQEFGRELLLAAGSTLWNQDRCAEFMRDRFADRLRDIRKLVSKIPPDLQRSRSQEAAATQIGSLQNETVIGSEMQDSAEMTMSAGRAMASTIAHAGSSTGTEDEEARTRVGSGRQDSSDRRERSRGSSESSLRRTRDRDSRDRLPPPSSGSKFMPAFIAAIVALVVGGVGGALVFKNLERQAQQNQPAQPPVVTQPTTPTPPKQQLGRFSLKTDRSAKVIIAGQVFGSTPIEGVVVPAGKQMVVLQVPDGNAKQLNVTVPVDGELSMDVRLDTLSDVP